MSVSRITMNYALAVSLGHTWDKGFKILWYYESFEQIA